MLEATRLVNLKEMKVRESKRIFSWREFHLCLKENFHEKNEEVAIESGG